MIGIGIADRTTVLAALADHLMRQVARLDFDDESFGQDGQIYPGLDGDLWRMPSMQAVAEGAMDGIT